jgi:G:T-mismatch repair DNA endonuclease (very short patch repair protein)
LVKICKINTCNEKHFAKGYCKIHYWPWKRHGDPLYNSTHAEFCSVDRCNLKYYSKGFCRNHYSFWKKYGDPLKRADPELTKKKLSESAKGRKHSVAAKRKMSESSKRENLSAETLQKMSESHSTPEQKQRQRKVLRNNQHNQTSPTIPESKIMEILTTAGIKYKFNPNVDYLTSENKHHKKEVDFLIKPKKIIEFNGYRHYDNRNFKPNDIVIHHNKSTTCQDIWNEEKMILQQIKNEGYRILIIWDMDLKKDIENITKKILKFAKS